VNARSFDDLSKIIPNKFLLTMVIAARAKQLEQGAEKKAECQYTNSIDVAIEEIYQRKLNIQDIIDGFQANLAKEDVITREIQTKTLDSVVSEHIEEVE